MTQKHAEEPGSGAGRFAYEGLERILHEKARLSIMTSLMTRPDGLVFGELKQLCSLSDGNLSKHLELLSEAGLLKIWKGYEGKRPQTLLRITPLGRERFLHYLRQLETVIQDALSKEETQAKPAVKDLPPGWAPA